VYVGQQWDATLLQIAGQHEASPLLARASALDRGQGRVARGEEKTLDADLCWHDGIMDVCA
jgi:hypothetical protein